MTMNSQDTHETCETSDTSETLSPVLPHPGFSHHISEDVNEERDEDVNEEGNTPNESWRESQLLMEVAHLTSEPLPRPRCNELINSRLSWKELLHLVTRTSRTISMPGLLWGFGDQIKVDLIISKMSRRESHILASLCWEWVDVIMIRQLFRTRANWSAPHTYVLLSFTPSITVRVLVLYSIKDGFWILLPPIPTVDGGSYCSEIVVLNDKIYVMGGGLGCIGETASTRVYMLDIAGKKSYWQRCADMKEPRASFGSAVLNGKIYVFGGISSLNTTDASEVYDPEEDSWSSVTAMRSFSRFGHRVTTLGNEITLQGGSIIVDRQFYLSDCNPLIGPSFMRQVYGDFMDIFVPGEDEWSTAMPLIRAPREVLFVVAQRLYSMSHSSIHLLEDRARNSWIKVHSFKLPVFAVLPTLLRPGHYGFVELEGVVVVPTAVLPVNDELVAIFAMKPGKCIRAPEYKFRYMLARSHGFRKENVEISWEEIEVPHCFSHAKCWYQTHSISLIQL